jgi:DNA-binding NarL/FixJ family response regulator
MTRISVLVVEDDPIFLGRFSHVVAGSTDLSLMAAVGDLASARSVMSRQAPDVLLTDLGLPDGSGVDLIREAAARHPHTDIMVVTVFGDEEHVIASIEAGATGYILKDSLPGEFVEVIKQLRAGGSPISPTIARQLLRRMLSVQHMAAPRPEGVSPESMPRNGLSARETEVLGFITKGCSFVEIAHLLEVSPHTITAHVKSIYQKLAVHSRGEAAYEATRLGLG